MTQALSQVALVAHPVGRHRKSCRSRAKWNLLVTSTGLSWKAQLPRLLWKLSTQC